VKLPRIKITRTLEYREAKIRIELGKWWEIEITRPAADNLISLASGFKPKDFRTKEFIKRIKAGRIIPYWYGYAYYDFNRDTGVYMPIPFNVLRALWAWVKMKVKYDIPHKLSKQNDAYEQGRRDGYREGVEDGYRTGFEECANK